MVSEILNRIALAVTLPAPIAPGRGPYPQPVITIAAQWARPGIFAAVGAGNAPESRIASNQV
jgi:hypothetical protein